MMMHDMEQSARQSVLERLLSKLDELDLGRLKGGGEKPDAMSVEIDAKPMNEEAMPSEMKSADDTDLVENLPSESKLDGEQSSDKLSADDLDPEMLDKLRQMYSQLK